jgi:hypothetical protein
MATPNDSYMMLIAKALNEDYSGDASCEPKNFTPEDYALAKKLVEQVGGAAEARELIDNLDQALEVLDMADYDDDGNINDIAGYTPDSVDFPVGRQDNEL